MNIAISGSHGLIGSALKKALEARGDTVYRLSRDFSKTINFSGIDAVIHLAGESIAEGRWNTEKKKRIENSRVEGTRLLAQQISESSHQPKVFISASAIGYYGNRGSMELDETSQPGSDFLSTVCRKWESSAKAVEQAGIRTALIRTGIVLSEKGGALKKMLPPFKMGAGGILGNGNQYMSWIALDDMISAIMYIMEKSSLFGPVNLVAPHPKTNKDFTKTLGKVIKRPTIMPLPAFAARLLFGEMADALLLSSTRVVPKKLIDAGYSFEYPELQPALEHILNEKK